MTLSVGCDRVTVPDSYGDLDYVPVDMRELVSLIPLTASWTENLGMDPLCAPCWGSLTGAVRGWLTWLWQGSTGSQHSYTSFPGMAVVGARLSSPRVRLPRLVTSNKAFYVASALSTNRWDVRAQVWPTFKVRDWQKLMVFSDITLKGTKHMCYVIYTYNMCIYTYIHIYL